MNRFAADMSYISPHTGN